MQTGPVELRHPHVGQDHVEVGGLDQREGIETVGGDLDLVAFGPQRRGQHARQLDVVVDDQHAPLTRRPRHRRRQRRFRFLRPPERQLDDEEAAAAGRGLHADRATVGGDDVVAERQAEPGAFLR